MASKAPTKGSRRAAALMMSGMVGLAAACIEPAVSRQNPATVESPRNHVIGELRLHEFQSQVFGNVRMLRVLVPDGYDLPAHRERRYPVLYLNDGQNLFDSSTSVFSGMEWQVDETVQALVSGGAIAPVIVVGIDHAGRRERFREYFPYVDEYLQPPEPDPQGKRYPEFLVSEVIPFVEARYRVAQEPGLRGIGGSSAGALAAIMAVITHPGSFGRVLIESPSIYVDDAHILEDARSVNSWPDRIYLGAGTNESGSAHCDPEASGEPELVRDLRRFEQLLREAGVDPKRIKVVITPCGVHNESAWAQRLPDALTFLYGTQP